MSSNNDRLSKTIMFLRFPLIVAVVFIHTNLADVMINGRLLVNEGQFPIHDLFRHIITNELARIAVPLFFFISGFLFFYHTDFSMKMYKQKLKKRVRTLLVPYLFWNTVVFLLFFLTQIFFSSMTSGRNKLIVDYGWLDWMNLFWNYREGMPVCYQFWFIRDLIFVVLFVPVLYYFIKYCKAFAVVLLGGLWLFDLWFDMPGVNIAAFFFFSLGAWFSIYRHDFTTIFLPLRWLATFLYLILMVVGTLLWYYKVSDCSWIYNVGIIVGLLTIVSWVAYNIERNILCVNTFLAGSAFFVYAYHGMPVAFLTKYWVRLCQPASELTMLTGYFLIPLWVTGIGIFCYSLLRKWFPAFTNLITGGR
ncbi:MAG: acyltransferase [Phocaeicola dorei]|jgi:fucose 4-O-acetylase-like acetyltransferase|uniref:acyltransferase family protein n=1 Tax=Phocaeicola TaxID=909656 RepID=UPI0011114D68|nr:MULTISPECIES: acyltransferase family protein [Phocaeicola]MBV4186261.1 acyltransferase [Phocaeicola vulgatus]MCD8251632.1 acyltransferase [Phocaeicola dorei]MDC7172332.1 acyltransferase family protein [Phocaeicola dorei]